MKRSLITVGIVLAVALQPAITHAATSGTSLTTSPVALTLTAKPGTTTTAKLQVMNNGTQPVSISTQVALFRAYGNTGQAAIINAPPTGDTSLSWVHLNPSSFIAQPGIWTQISMSLSLPKDAELGYYYAILFHPNVSNTSQQPAATLIHGSNAVLVLVDTQSGSEERAMSIAKFKSDKGFYEYLPATFTITVQNSGNIYDAPRGDIFISRRSDMRNTLTTIQLNPGGGNILPNSSRNFTVSWDQGFPQYQPKVINGVALTANGQPVRQLQWDFTKLPNFRLGEYYAKLTVVYNNGDRDVPLTEEISFWVIPWRLLLVAVALGLLLTVGLWSILRSIAKHIHIQPLRNYRR